MLLGIIFGSIGFAFLCLGVFARCIWKLVREDKWEEKRRVSFQLEEESVWEMPEGAPEDGADIWAEKKKKLRLVVKPSLAQVAAAAGPGPPKPKLADFLKLTTDVDAEKVAQGVEDRMTKVQARMSTAGARMSKAFGAKSGPGEEQVVDDFKQQAVGWMAAKKKFSMPSPVNEDEEMGGEEAEATSNLKSVMKRNINPQPSLLAVAQAEKSRQVEEKRAAIEKKKAELEKKKALLASMQKKFDTTKAKNETEVSAAAGRFKKLGAKALKEEGANDAEDAWFSLGDGF